MIVARAMTDADRPFVACTWARGSRYGLRTREAFRFVNRLLDSETTRVVVLATDSTVHAWAAGCEDALHYAYVPPELRRCGLARRAITELLGSYPDRIDVTHRWPFASPRFRHSPHLLLRTAA